MIIVKLIGGLGNQMFQYATARALAYRHGVELKLDTSFLLRDAEGKYTQRNYELSVFEANPKIATEIETASFLKFGTNRLFRELQRLVPELFGNLYIAENSPLYFKNFIHLPNHTYLDGFWQSEKYFNNIRHILLSDFQIKTPVPPAVRAWQEKISQVKSIAVHVRRGDYLNSASAQTHHGSCSINYYQQAVQHIIDEQGPGEIFVFSDDIKWCRNHLKFNTQTNYVEHAEAACWDMFLMSQCNGNVIANSSFSWWAAWLNQQPDKIVIMPENWLTGVRSSSLDIVATNWRVMPG